METITHLLSSEHTDCDKWFAQAEADVAQQQWERALNDFSHFKMAMEQHFSKEEQVLFPAVEQRLGQTDGPTAVMRMEHQQMRQLFTEMENCLTQQAQEQYLGFSETLLMLMQQHNAKEEQILYPLSDSALNNELATMLKQLRQSGETA